MENPDLLIELPILPEEMMTGEFGTGKFDKDGNRTNMVGRLNKALTASVTVHGCGNGSC